MKANELFLIPALMLANAAFAATSFGPFSLDAKANIFAAGGNIALQPAPATGGPSDGVSPYEINFGATPAGSSFTVSTLAGSVGCVPGASNGADGTCFGGVDTNINSAGSISGIFAESRNMFIVGVFLGAGAPAGAAPANTSYPDPASVSAASYTPLLNQVFFIGDGLTGTGAGTVQKFFVPSGATRLYLGFADAFNFSGNNGYYNDNVNSFRVSATLDNGAVPEPSTFALAGAALAVVMIGRFRKA